jgi:hypothetical protein
VYPATTSHAALPDERRRNPRHRAPSIMYVQMDAANGGIVLNLGIDGVAFHAAQKLIAEKNSTLKLRLRGSGLLVDLTGELVWLSASQKEAGIRFKDLSGTVRQEIAGWIAREAQVFGPTGVEDHSQSKTIPATPGLFDTGDMSERHPLSAALSISRAKPADDASGANEDANGLFSPLPLDYVPPKSYLSPRQGVVSPKVEHDFSDDEWEDEPQGRDPYSSLPPLPPRIEQHLHVQPPPETAPIETPRQSQASYSSPYLLSLKQAAPARGGQLQAPPEAPGMNDLRKTGAIEPGPVPPPLTSSPFLLSLEKKFPARREPPQTSAESAARSEFRKADEIEPMLGPAAGNSSTSRLSLEPIPPVRGWRLPVSAQTAGISQLPKTAEVGPIPQARVSLSQDKLGVAAAVDGWIPPALLAAWRRADVQHKVLFASSGLACLGIFALILTLAVSHTDSSLPAAEETAHLQQPTVQQPAAQQAAAQPLTTQQFAAQQFTVPPAATSVSNNFSQAALIQAPVAVPRRSVRSRKTLLAVFAQALVGFGSRDADARHRLRDDQLGVQVWTSKRNGYFYCTDSEFYKSVQPGAFMIQRDAIQSGYQPRIGQFCN